MLTEIDQVRRKSATCRKNLDHEELLLSDTFLTSILENAASSFTVVGLETRTTFVLSMLAKLSVKVRPFYNKCSY